MDASLFDAWRDPAHRGENQWVVLAPLVEVRGVATRPHVGPPLDEETARELAAQLNRLLL